MIEAELPDGRVLEFPEGTDSAVVQSTVKRMLGVKTPAPKSSYLTGNLSPLGGVDAAASLISGAVAGPVSGLAGIGQGLLNTLRGGMKNPQEGMPAADRVQQVQEALTYQPRTEAGQGLTDAISYPFVKLAELGDFAGGKTAEGTGSPAAGAAANTTLQAIPLMLGRVAPRKTAGKTPQQSLYDAGTVRAKEAGYVLPPTQVNPSVWNQIVEGVSGKIKTAQAASLKNQDVTNGLVKKGLGLSDEAPLTVETLAQVRKNAGQAYERVRASGDVVTDPVYSQALDSIAAPFERAAKDFPKAAQTQVIEAVEAARVPGFNASSAVDQISILRDKADGAFRSGDKKLGGAYKEIAGALEQQLARHLEKTGAPKEVISDFQQARQRIAKTYTVQKHLNDKGNVDAQGLARELQKGKPLSGELKTAAEFGQQFHRAAQRPERVGGVPMSMFEVGVGPFTSAMTLDPSYLALSAIRPAMRSAVLSKPFQDTFVNPRGTNPSILERLRATQEQPLVPLSEIAEGQRSY